MRGTDLCRLWLWLSFGKPPGTVQEEQLSDSALWLLERQAKRDSISHILISTEAVRKYLHQRPLKRLTAPSQSTTHHVQRCSSESELKNQGQSHSGNKARTMDQQAAWVLLSFQNKEKAPNTFAQNNSLRLDSKSPFTQEGSRWEPLEGAVGLGHLRTPKPRARPTLEVLRVQRGRRGEGLFLSLKIGNRAATALERSTGGCCATEVRWNGTWTPARTITAPLVNLGRDVVLELSNA